MTRRATVWIVAVLVLLGIAALAIVATLQRVEPRGVLARRLSAATGREVSIKGPVRLQLGLPLGLRFTDLAVGEPTEPSLLRSARVGRLDLVFALWPLLRGELDLHHVEVEGAELTLDLAATRDEAGGESGREPSTAWSIRSADARSLDIQLLREGAPAIKGSLERIRLRSHESGEVIELDAAGQIAEIPFDLAGRYHPEARPGAGKQGADLEVQGQIAGAKVSGTGTLGDATGIRDLELRVSAEAPHLKDLSVSSLLELPRLGPVRVSGLLEAKGETFGVSDLDVRVGNRDTAWLKVSGYVKDLRNRRQLSLRFDFGIADVHALKPLVGEPPDIGRIEGKATLNDVAGTRRLEEFTLKGGRPGVFEINAEGRFLDIESVDGLDAHVDLKARDLAVLGELLHRELPPIAPVEFTGRVSGRSGEVVTEGVRGRLAKTHFEGALSVSFGSGPRPRFTASLKLPELHLEDIGIEPRTASETSEAADSATPPTTTSSERLFADKPLDLGWIGAADGELSLVAERVIGVGGPLLSAAKTDLRIREGTLSLRHASAHYDGGTVRGQLELDSRAEPPTVSLRASAQAIRLERLVAQLDERGAYSGSVDASLDLRSRGNSPRALASDLDGEVLVGCGRGTIDPRHAGVMTRDLLRALHRVAGAPTSEVLNCLIVDFSFRKGVGSARTLLLDAEEIVVVGEGEVDLGRETLDLRLVPRPRRAGLLSTAATVRVTGSLMEPRVKIEKGSLVKSSTEAMFTHLLPVGTLHRLWPKIRGKQPGPSPCKPLAGSP